MKFVVLVFLGWLPLSGRAQQHASSFAAIDAFARNITASTPDSLALKLTAPFSNELHKARAIYSWITQHISYNTGIFASFKKQYTSKYGSDPLDTMAVWKSGEEMMAIRVMHRRVTVCEGYSKLFKVLCDHAGLESRIIVGYAKGNPSRPGKFRTNHAWNAVRIDSSWYLADPTWGSGYIDHRQEFVQHLNDEYFMADPERFVLDHYPEDIRWTLLQDPPTIREFYQQPFRYKSFDKYSLDPYHLGEGVIRGREGDTIRIVLQARNLAKDEKISPDPFFDSTMVADTGSAAYLRPSLSGKSVAYHYVVSSSAVQWLHLYYNDDLVLRYHLVVRRRYDP